MNKMTTTETPASNKFVTKGKVKEVKGSITLPENAGLRMILNLCSTSGKWDTKAESTLSKKWKKAQEEYRSWYVNRSGFKAGANQTVAVQSDVWVVNLVCLNDKNELDEAALKKCLREALAASKYEHASVHVSGFTVEGNDELKTLLTNTFSNEGIHIYFYNE